MKKLLFLFFAFSMIQVSAQNLSSTSKSASSSNGSMIENLASDQVKSLTRKLNLNEKQQEQVSGLVINQLKSDKFQKIISGLGADSLMNSKDGASQTDNLQSALLSDEVFQKEMGSVLDKEQMEKMKVLIPQ
ncbi:hypothetical protein [Xanthomarina sp. F2636L]|uniref:hypothetical protein n=1 Tax=Xanthomarina sp. F2636L TaxID=2996018 RepID=UPI00225E1E16|nr:hypothetical protein [Xanthomarina sp. F2636L]MCX7550836.1 hypothetical protein [Xanthomarina sp. F2636L]